MSCFIKGSLFTEVLPLCGCLTFLKANKSPGLKTSFGSLWTCAQCAVGPLCEEFACAFTESTCSHSWCRGCGGPERSFRFWHCGHYTRIVLALYGSSSFPAVSGKHWMYCPVYHSLYHLLYCPCDGIEDTVLCTT